MTDLPCDSDAVSSEALQLHVQRGTLGGCRRITSSNIRSHELKGLKSRWTADISAWFHSTCFFGRDCQNVAAVARAHAVGGKHAEVVALSWMQVHQGEVAQVRVQDLGRDGSVPGG